jgi:hypothetical protein
MDQTMNPEFPCYRYFKPIRQNLQSGCTVFDLEYRITNDYVTGYVTTKGVATYDNMRGLVLSLIVPLNDEEYTLLKNRAWEHICNARNGTHQDGKWKELIQLSQTERFIVKLESEKAETRLTHLAELNRTEDALAFELGTARNRISELELKIDSLEQELQVATAKKTTREAADQLVYEMFGGQVGNPF